MNQNRRDFLIRQSKRLLELTQVLRKEEEELYRPGTVSAVQWLRALEEHPGSNAQELAHYMDSGLQVAQQTMRCFAIGGVVRQEIPESEGSKPGPDATINFIINKSIDTPVRGS